MIGITHFREDYIAAGITNRLLLEYRDFVEVIPKDYRRRWNIVEDILKRVDALIFLMFDENAYFDKGTLKELKFFVEQKKPLYIIIPESVKRKFIKRLGNFPNMKIITFNPYTQDIKRVVANIIERERDDKVKDDIIGVIIVLGLLMFLSLLIISSSKK